VRWQYDGDNQYESYFDAEDRAVAYKLGCTIYRAILDQRIGKQSEGDCLDAQGHLLRGNSGAAIIRTKYDDHGREIEKTRYGEDQQLVSLPNYAIVRKKYDDHGNQVEEAYFGEDGRLRLGPDGYAIFRSKYDDHGNQTENAYFGEDEKLRLGPDGYAIFRSKYDHHGRQTEEAYFDVDERPRVYSKYGAALIRVKYDDYGNIAEFAAFGESGELQLLPDGYAGYRAKYDDHGNQTEIAYLGEEGKLRVHPHKGYAVMRKKYDTRGNEVEEAYFGEDEKLRLGPNGYAIGRGKYDDQGKQTEIAYFGEDQKPLIPPNYGYASERIKYDPHGNIIERAYFSEDGKLRHQPDDYAVERMKYDDQGNEVEEAYFGPDGALTSAASFPIITKMTEIVVRDERQALKARCRNDDIADFLKLPKGCSDAENKPIVSHPLIVGVFEPSRAQELGLRIGDLIEAYDGKPVFVVPELIDLITQAGEAERRIDLIRQGQRLVLEAPPGRLGIRVGITFVPADQSSSAEHAGR
jgi:YD repeat-containing protein